MKALVCCLLAAILYGVSYIFSKNALMRMDYWTAAFVSDVVMFVCSLAVYAVALRFFGASFNPSQIISLGSVNAVLTGSVRWEASTARSFRWTELCARSWRGIRYGLGDRRSG